MAKLLKQTTSDERFLNNIFLQNIIDAIQDGVTILDPDLNILKVNKQQNIIYEKYKPLIGKKCYKVFHQRNTPCPACPTIKVLKTGKQQIETIHYVKENGYTGWIELTSYPVKNQEGKIVYIIEHSKDITERKKLEEKLNLLYRTLNVIRYIDQLIINAADQKVLFENTCNILVKNKEYTYACALLVDDNLDIKEVYSAGIDFDTGELITKISTEKNSDGRNLREKLKSFIHKKSLKKSPILVKEDYEGICLKYIEGKAEPCNQIIAILEYSKKLYGILIIGISLELQLDKDELEIIGELANDLAFALYNIELRKSKEDEEKLLRSIIDHSLTGLLIIDNNFRFTFVNKKCCDFLNTSREDMIGHDFRELLPEETRDMVVDRYLRRHRGENPPERYEAGVLTKNGEIIRMDISTNIIHNSKGDKYSVSHIIDVTENRLRECIHKILHSITMSSKSFSEKGFFEDLGFDKLSELFLIDKIELVFYDEKKERFMPVYKKSKNDTITTKTENLKPVFENILKKAFHDKKTKLITKGEIIKSISKNDPELEKLIPESWLLIPLVSDNRTIGFLNLYSKKRKMHFRNSIIKIMEEFATELATYILHKKIEDETKRLAIAIESAAEYIIVTDPNGNIQYVNPAFEKITGYKREEVIGENPRILKSGRHNQNFYRNLWNTIKSGRTWRGEFINRKKDGTIYYEEAVISPVFDKSGTITSFVAVKHDVTEKKNLEDQYMQAQKMEAIGRLAGGIAHDFNNMLSVIMGYSELILNKLDKNSEIYSEIEEIYKAGLRSSELTAQLLAFARKQTVKPKIIDLNDEISTHLKMLRRLIGENIKLHWIPGEPLWKVKLDPGQLSQILNNLCINARDAINDVGNITIETKNMTIDSSYHKLHPFVKEGEYVMVAVTDDGKGMDEHVKFHIFEPFFTTKTIGEGTGLGLSSVYGAVKQNNGFILVYSEPGKGTTFKIYFPRYTGTDETAENNKHAIKKGKGEVVLLVEDETQILEITKKMIENIGYKVLPANNPNEALEIVKIYSGKINLLITDVVMPDMNGLLLARKIKSIYPDLKVIFMSGYTTNVINHEGVIDKEYYYLQKPFDIATLSEKIHQVLGK